MDVAPAYAARPTALSDDELIRRIREQGCRLARDALWLRHAPWIRRRIGRWAWACGLALLDTEDAQQHALFAWDRAVWMHTAGRPFKPILRKVLRDTFCTFVKNLHRRRPVPLPPHPPPAAAPMPGEYTEEGSGFEPADDHSDPAALAEWGERQLAVCEAVRHLPDDLRCVAEPWILGRTLPQIARALGLSRGQVKWRLERVRCRLGTVLHDQRDWCPATRRPQSLASPLLAALAGR
jgi:DNA-directed RNA polymerase specialized sigma24 family protein